MVVISEPRKELVSEGQSIKYVKDCKQLYLGDKGIEKLRGFEDFTNLEVLWLNNNRLKKINNLDKNFRIRVLCAQDNQICTLKGSIVNFKFLEELDLSNNQLRDLEKLLGLLDKFQFMTHLNLKGNPCCEEPDYRLHVIYHIPSLRVLDQHVITTLERTKAKALIGGDVQTLTVAFGKRAPPYNPVWDEKVPERSVLEQELLQEATSIVRQRAESEHQKMMAAKAHKPYGEPVVTRGRGLPPNAGTMRAMELWNQKTQQSAAAHGGGSDSADEAGGAQPAAQGDLVVLYSLRARSNPDLATTRLTKPAPGSIKFDQSAYESYATRKMAGAGQWELTRSLRQI